METQEQPAPTSGGTGKYVLGIIAIVLVAAGINIFGTDAKNTDKTKTQTASVENAVIIEPAASGETNTEKTVTSASAARSTVEVEYTDQGFAPATVTVKIGDTVKFVNKSTETMWVGSDDHPSHTKYSGTKLREHCPDTTGTAFDQCSRGDEYSFTFGKAGSWNYHNHADASMEGTVVVTK